MIVKFAVRLRLALDRLAAAKRLVAQTPMVWVALWKSEIHLAEFVSVVVSIPGDLGLWQIRMPLIHMKRPIHLKNIFS
jgi:hypothetical protein